MERSEAKISVIVPAYNAEKFLSKTLDSVMQQTLKPFEVIVIDDGSEDQTKAITSHYDVIYAHQKNGGTATALNHGIEIAQGNIYALLDHDDIWSPQKLEKQLDVLIAHPEVDMVFSLLENIIINEEIENAVDVDFGPLNGIHKSSFMIKKTSFDKVGKFSTDSGTQEFLDWFSNALDKDLNAHTVQEVLVQRTIHGTNQTILNKEMKNDFPKVIKAILDRRRRSQNLNN